jgi:hypothetical protein
LESPDREQRGGDGGTTFPTVITDFIFTEFNNVNFTEFLTSTFFQIPTSISYHEFPPLARSLGPQPTPGASRMDGPGCREGDTASGFLR